MPAYIPLRVRHRVRVNHRPRFSILRSADSLHPLKQLLRFHLSVHWLLNVTVVLTHVYPWSGAEHEGLWDSVLEHLMHVLGLLISLTYQRSVVSGKVLECIVHLFDLLLFLLLVLHFFSGPSMLLDALSFFYFSLLFHEAFNALIRVSLR